MQIDESCLRLKAKSFEQKLVLAIRTVWGLTGNRLPAIGAPDVSRCICQVSSMYMSERLDFDISLTYLQNGTVFM